jgi:hypothetical protein
MPAKKAREKVDLAVESVRYVTGKTPSSLLGLEGMFQEAEFRDLLKWYPSDRIHKCAPGPDRANIRSATPRGFAQAVFEANGKAL